MGVIYDQKTGSYSTPSPGGNVPPADNRFQDYVNQMRGQRQIDMQQGAARGDQLFGAGSNFQDIVNKRRDFLSGYSPEEQNALKAQMTTANQSNTATALRQLQSKQGRAGVYGPAAAAQEADLLKAGNNTQQQAEAGLFAKNIDLKRSALGDYENAVGKQTAGQLSTEMGYGSLGAADRGSAMQKIAGEDYSKAAIAAANSGGKK